MSVNLRYIRSGLYVVTRPKQGVTHFAILDIGSRLGLNGPRPDQPIVVHMTPAGLGWSYFSEPSEWTMVGVVEDEGLARPRLLEALKNPTYDVFGNNCEHFANLVSQGIRRSAQVSNAVFAVILITGLAYLFGSRKGRRR